MKKAIAVLALLPSITFSAPDDQFALLADQYSCTDSEQANQQAQIQIYPNGKVFIRWLNAKVDRYLFGKLGTTDQEHIYVVAWTANYLAEREQWIPLSGNPKDNIRYWKIIQRPELVAIESGISKENTTSRYICSVTDKLSRNTHFDHVAQIVPSEYLLSPNEASAQYQSDVEAELAKSHKIHVEMLASQREALQLLDYAESSPNPYCRTTGAHYALLFQQRTDYSVTFMKYLDWSKDRLASARRLTNLAKGDKSTYEKIVKGLTAACKLR